MASLVAHWDITDMPPAEGLDGWREILPETCVPLDPGSPSAASPEHPAQMERRQAGALRIIDRSGDPCGGIRRSCKIAATTDDWAIVLFSLCGREIFEGDGCGELRPESCGPWQSTRPAHFTVLEPERKRCLFAPRAELENGCPGFRQLMAMPPGDRSAETRLFFSFLAEAIRAFPALSPCGLTAAAGVIAELLGAALRPQCYQCPLARVSLHDALFARTCSYIDRHLGDPSLRPKLIAGAHHISLRTLQLIFAERGETVSDRIRRLRLDRCQTDIAQSGRSIASVGRRWGFVDAAHFSRVFKDRYGVSPREARATVRQGESIAST